MATCYQQWTLLTRDQGVLHIVSQGVCLDFVSVPPQGRTTVYQPCLSATQMATVAQEIESMLRLKVIAPSPLANCLWISPIFTTLNKDGTSRLILNLKKLNLLITHIPFKMESIRDVIHLIKPGVWMASVDLHHAYYSVPVYSPHSHYFSFLWQGTYYRYLLLPNGYAQAPLIFTKLLRLPFGFLRSQGHLSVIYMDDTYLQGDTVSTCQRNVDDTVSLLQTLGFNINGKKSVLTPTQTLEFLGFLLDSVHMTITLTPRRKSNIAEVCAKLLLKTHLKIRFVSSAIGMIIAALLAVRHGALHYRAMERDKISALRDSGGDFDQLMTLSPAAGGEVRWWIAHVAHSQKFLHAPPLTTIIYSDASLEGWGATDSISTVGAPWQVAALLHINVLELTAAHFALLHLAADARGVHIQLKLDYLTAVAYINKMGGTHSPECNQVAQQIWEWAVDRDVWLSAAYIPGDSNVVADFHSRCFHENKEWALKVSVFALLRQTLICLLPRGMRSCRYIFHGYRTGLLMRWMLLLSPGGT